MAIEICGIREHELERVDAIQHEAFRAARRPEAWLRAGRALVEGDQVQAVVLVEHVGQFFGGRSIPVAVVSSLAVDLPARGRGLGGILLRETLAEFRAAGIPLSIHFPRLLSSHSRVGYEFAGLRIRYRAPVDATPLGADLSIQPWRDTDLDDVARCYDSYARATNGALDRTPDWWHERVLTTEAGAPQYRYLVRRNGDVSGYLIYIQEPVPDPAGDIFSIAARDLVWLDAVSAKALLGVIAYNAPFARDLHWDGPVEEPLAAFFEVEIRVAWTDRWMLRLVDVVAALEGRGYPSSLHAGIEFAISDAILPANDGALRLEVAGGRGAVTRIEGARARLDVATLAALYTGWLPAREAVRLGRLQGATPQQVEMLELIFAGPKPWMMDGA